MTDVAEADYFARPLTDDELGCVLSAAITDGPLAACVVVYNIVAADAGFESIDKWAADLPGGTFAPWLVRIADAQWHEICELCIRWGDHLDGATHITGVNAGLDWMNSGPSTLSA